MYHRYLAVATLALGLAAVASAAPAFAQSTPAPSPMASAAPRTVKPALSTPTPAPTVAPTAAPTKLINLSGYGAAAYTRYAGTSTPSDRVFDTHPDEFDLQAVDIKTQINLPQGFGITAESSFGTDADGLASRGTSNSDGFDLPQAYISYTKGNFSAIAGRFASLAGAEVFQDPNDYEFSRSILYGYAEPFTHTGVRATYAFDSAKYTINAGVVNGWDDIKFVGKGLTAEFGPSVVISPVFSATAAVYDGHDYTSSYAGGPIMPFNVAERSLYDFVLTTKATPKLTLVSNYDNGNQQETVFQGTDAFGNPVYTSAHWTGFSQIGNYQISPVFNGSLRGEVYHDGGGFHTGTDQFLREGTATFAYTPKSNLLFRAEYRVDGSDYPTFMQTTNGAFINHQNSIAIESAVKF